MYAASDKGLYMSTDGGAHWFNSNQGNEMWVYAIGQAVAVNPVNPNIVYFGGYGLAKSRDGGFTWEGGYGSNYLALAIDPRRPNVVYASTSHDGLQKSTDGGWIWTTLTGGSGQSDCVEIDPFNPDIVYADVGKTTDAGTTWAPLFSGEYRPISVIKASRTEPGVLYAGWDDYQLGGTEFRGGMSKSTNGGQTWTDLNIPEKTILSIATDPVRPKVVYYGTYYGVFRSEDGGATWAEIDKAHRPGAGFRSLLIDPNNPDYLLAGTDFSGIYRINVTHSASSELFLTSPSGLERMTADSDFTIRWFSKNAAGNVKIDFSSDGGKNYSTITSSTENDGEYLWKAPGQPAADCRIRISQVGGSLTDTIDRPFSVVACEYSVDVRSWPYRYDGEDGLFVVTSLSLGGSCPWTALSEADWITITSGAQGSTDAIVRFAVTPNTGDYPRTGTVSVAGKKLAVEQECRPCYASDFGVTPHEMRIPKEGGLYQVLGTVNRGNCPWNPQTSETWIQIKETKESGETMMVTFTISPNGTGSRWGWLAVGGQPVQILQSGSDQPDLTYNYLLPYLKTGIDPVSNESFLTGIAFSNSLETPATGLVTAYDLDGSTLKAPFNPNEFGVAPKTPLARQAPELLHETSSDLREGWLEMRANQRLGVFFMFGSPEQMDGSLALTKQSRKLYFTRVSEGAAAFRGKPVTTEIVVVNPSLEAIIVRMTLFGCPGSAGCAEITRTIAPHAVCKGSVAELFATSEISSGYVMVEVTQGTGAIGFGLMHLTGQKALVGLNAVAMDASQVLYSAQLATIPGIFTDVKLVNTASADRKVTLEAIDEEGKRISAPFAVTLSPGQSLERDAAVLFPVAPNGFVGTLRVTADGTGVIGDVVFGDPGLRFASALLMQTAAFTEGLFGHVAQGQSGGEGLYTGLALYNPADQPANINIQVFGGFDLKVGERDLQLGPGCRTAKLIDELMPSVSQQIGGYILIKSDKPIIAQELFSNGRFLSAVPPTQLSPAP